MLKVIILLHVLQQRGGHIPHTLLDARPSGCRLCHFTHLPFPGPLPCTIIRVPIHLPRVPRPRTPTTHVTTPLPFPPISAWSSRPRDPRVVLSHTRAARSSLPGCARRHFDPSPLFSPLFLLPSTLYIIE
ncbi:hypothetical protein V8E52_008870 [Russula decolorans]